MLVSTFEVLVKPQFPKLSSGPNVPPVVADLAKITRNVIQGYFLTIANVNFFPLTVSVVFTVKFPKGGIPKDFTDFLSAVDISGINLLPTNPLAPKLVPETQEDKARLTVTIPANTTGLLILQPNILKHGILKEANFEARGYVEIFLSSLSGSNEATLLVTPEHRGTFYKDINGATPADIGLDQIAYPLPVSNGGVFVLSNS